MYDPDFDWDEVDKILQAGEASAKLIGDDSIATAIAETGQSAASDGCEILIDAPSVRKHLCALAEDTNGTGRTADEVDCEEADIRRAHVDSSKPDIAQSAVVDAGRKLADCTSHSFSFVGSWEAHGAPVTMVRFDRLSCDGDLVLFSGSWDEARLRRWRLPNGQTTFHGDQLPDSGASPIHATPKPMGQMPTGGFLNEFLVLSGKAMLLAVSAGLFPTPGESLKTFQFNDTPLGQPSTASVADQSQEAQTRRCGLDAEARLAASAQKVFLHTRGCRAVSCWPKPDNLHVLPDLVGSISKDTLGVCRVCKDGTGLQVPEEWSVQNPHGMTEVNAVCWESRDRLWSGANDGTMKLWDVSARQTKCVHSVVASAGAWIRHIDACPSLGVLVGAHSDGLSCVDPRSRRAVWHQYGKGQSYVARFAGGSSSPGLLLAGHGRTLVRYDVRRLGEASWEAAAIEKREFGSPVLSMHCFATDGDGDIPAFCAAVGCKDGSVSIFKI